MNPLEYYVFVVDRESPNGVFLGKLTAHPDVIRRIEARIKNISFTEVALPEQESHSSAEGN